MANTIKVRFIFFHGKDSFVGKAIICWTWVLAAASLDFKRLKYNYSHVEIYLPDEEGFFKRRKWAGDKSDWRNKVLFTVGRCFSSTTRGDAVGVRMADAGKVLKHRNRWDYIEVEVEERVYSSLVKWCEKKAAEAAKYDFLGIFGFFSPINIQDDKKLYCSELCAELAFLFWILAKRYGRISPRRLAKVLAKRDGEPKPL